MHHGVDLAISLASFAYIAGGILLVIALVAFVKKDVARVQETVTL